MKSLRFEGNALPEVADLCQVASSYFDKDTNSRRVLTKGGSFGRKDPKSFAMSKNSKKQISMGSLFVPANAGPSIQRNH
jgi:hypothetical protein